LVSYPITTFPERHLFSEPVSPHYASQLEHKKILLSDFHLPQTNNNLIVEGAGGLLVPLNEQGDCVIDLVHQFELEVVLVIRLYLGCINHALLSINELKRNNIAIKGLVFNGNDQFGAIGIIEKLSNVPTLLHLPELPLIDAQVVSDCAKEVKL
jgi:dethiobiotin synthetase